MKLIRFMLSTGLVLFLAGCGRDLRNYELDEKTFDADASKMIQEFTGFHLPEGSHGLNFRYKPPIDPAFIAKVSIPNTSQDDVARQIASLGAHTFNENIIISGPAKPAWWKQTSEKIVAERKFMTKENRYVHAILCEDKEHLNLYIDCFLME
jgi:hypothetical protein